jgi:ATP-dependent RNA helicase DHX57
MLFPATISGAVTPPEMDWATLLANLGQKLVGNNLDNETFESDINIEERDTQRAAEFSALESVYPSATLVNGTSQALTSSTTSPESVTYLNIPIPNSPLTLHIILPAWHPYPLSASPPPMYISSNSMPSSASFTSAIPPYIRLHILSSILSSPIIENRDHGEGIGLVAAGIIEEEWEKIQTQGPPEIVDVLRHLMRVPTTPSDSPSGPKNGADQSRSPVSDKVVKRQGGLRTVRVGDDRSDAQIRVDFETVKTKAQYQSLFKERVKLPAWKAKSDFLQAFKTNRVVVCVGETGSGKTTQVPQYILDEYLGTSEERDAPSLAQLQIIVTQPRRVAAISVASRVSAERGDDGSVAYTIRGESTTTRRTKLIFCTTGVVLRRLTVGNGLDGVRVIVVDEVRMCQFTLDALP